MNTVIPFFCFSLNLKQGIELKIPGQVTYHVKKLNYLLLRCEDSSIA